MKRKSVNKHWTWQRLLALGIPATLIPGILLAITLGWNPKQLSKVNDYHQVATLFPKFGVVREVHDGDTFRLQNGVEVRLIGIDAPNRGERLFKTAQARLEGLIINKRVWLEYDRYQDDKYGRILAWVWLECEDEPTFTPADYMHLTYNRSREGLISNPKGCKQGVLINEALVDAGLANAQTYKERGELKYEKRIQN